MNQRFETLRGDHQLRLVSLKRLDHGLTDWMSIYRCIRIEPSNPTPLFFRGRCFHKSGDLKAALVDFDDATEKARARILVMCFFVHLQPNAMYMLLP